MDIIVEASKASGEGERERESQASGDSAREKEEQHFHRSVMTVEL